MMSDTVLTRESIKFPPAALFLETSAQILLWQGPPKIQKDIRDLIDATRNSSGQIGTSEHVKREFYAVINGFFDEVQGRINLLDDKETDRPFEELWREVRSVLMPKRYPGGHSLLDDLGDYLTDLYHGRLMRPAFLDSVVQTYREHIIRGFRSLLNASQLFDKSTCRVWETRGSCLSCDAEPSAECRLKEICVTDRSKFLTSAKTLANNRCNEKQWFQDNLESLAALEGKALQEFIGSHPDHVGDSIIFWEVPDGWTILSRDAAFQILTEKQRGEVNFFMVRIPRKLSGKSCTLRHEGADDSFEGTVDNYNSLGARIHSPFITFRARQRIVITAEMLGTRVGVITKARKFSSSQEVQQNKSRPTFGIRFRAR